MAFKLEMFELGEYWAFGNPGGDLNPLRSGDVLAVALIAAARAAVAAAGAELDLKGKAHITWWCSVNCVVCSMYRVLCSV